MTDQEILDNAPEGATHYDWNCDYWDLRIHNKLWLKDDDTWIWFSTYEEPSAYSLRSLADIKRIVELESDNLGLANESHAQQERIKNLQLSETVLFKMLREFWVNDFYPLEAVYDERLEKLK